MKLFYRVLPAVVLCLASLSAYAQPARTFVATTGSDTNPCSVAAPCRTLGPAITAVASGGDVLVLDSGGFGQNIEITKSVNVIAEPGIVARLRTIANGYGVRINAGGISVKLNGIGVTGTEGDGVVFAAGKSLEVRNAEIDIIVGVNAPYGIWHKAPGGFLTVDNVVVRNSFAGLFAFMDPSAGATVVNSFLHANRYGIVVDRGAMTVRDTTAAGKSTDVDICPSNFLAQATDSEAVTSLRLDNVVSTNCGRGFYSFAAVGGTAQLAVSNSLITGNASAGTLFGSATGRTYGDNRVFSNTTNTLTGFTNIGPQ